MEAAMLTMFCCLFRYTKYRITSLEKNYIPKMIVPEDIGIPLDLLDMSVYK
jgi:RNA polymerase II-associated factor 1